MADYKVGYKKPPVTSRFQPGQSGNPGGRPKGARSLANDLKAELEEVIVVSEGGEVKEMTKQQAVIKTMVANALKGEGRALQVLLNLKLVQDQGEAIPESEEILSEEEESILRNLKARMSRQSPSDKEGV